MIKRLTSIILIGVISALTLTCCAPAENAGQPIPVKVLILPKFEVGENGRSLRLS